MNQTVLITGCSTGFGKLCVNTFHNNGWNVVATMRSPEKERDLQEDDRTIILQLDVTDKSSISKAVKTATDRFGTIDVLVNNAGFGTRGIFEQTSDEGMRSMFETNVFGAMNMMWEVLPIMRANGSGRVINITSMAGLLGVPANCGYSATKFALEGLTEAMSMEYKDLGVLIKTVAPGAFPTAFSENVGNFASAGDEKIRAKSEKLSENFAKAINAGEPQDPQLVVDKIYECSTADTPVQNPVGADAQMLAGLIQSMPNREELINTIYAAYFGDK